VFCPETYEGRKSIIFPAGLFQDVVTCNAMRELVEEPAKPLSIIYQ